MNLRHVKLVKEDTVLTEKSLYCEAHQITLTCIADGARLPQTTKVQDGGHGFGLRSIQYTVEKYGGHMTIHPKENVFLLRVSIPIPE